MPFLGYYYSTFFCFNLSFVIISIVPAANSFPMTGIHFRLLVHAFLKMKWDRCLLGNLQILSSCPLLHGKTLQPKHLHLLKQHMSLVCKPILKSMNFTEYSKNRRENRFTFGSMIRI